MRSTGTTNRSQAKIICEAWASAEQAARDGALSTSRAAAIVNETLRRCGHQTLTQYRLGDWFSEWLAAKTNCRPQTLKRYRFAAARFIESLGGPEAERQYLDTIEERDIRHFIQTLRSQGRASSTIRRIIRDLNCAFARAVRLGKLERNPFNGVELQKDHDKLCDARQTFTPAQIIQLVQTARGTDWEGVILLAYSSGMRLADCCNLRWSEVDPVAGIINFRQRKTGRQTLIGLHLNFGDWLANRSTSDDPQAYIFPRLAGRRVDGKGGLSNQFNSLVRQAGIDAGLIREPKGAQGKRRRALSFHSLRHTAASGVYNAAAKEMARRITGHAERGSLEAYLHADLEAVKAAAALIPRLRLS
jgi:integrase